MESGCLTFTTASAPSRPSTVLTPNTSNVKQFQANRLLFPSLVTAESNGSSIRRRGGGGFSIKASKKSFFSPNQKLTSNWDVSNFSASPSGLPSFEELDPTNMLLRQRIVFLSSAVYDDIADFVISQLLFLDAEDSNKDIKLFINSPGGSVTAGMGIYDTMKLCKADVSTICMGLGASIAAFILATGTKGKRFCMPNARVMIHQPHGPAGGEVDDFGIRIKELMYHKIKVDKILSRVTGKSVEQIDQDTKRDFFMNAWEAKEYGLVDEVIDDGKPGLVAPTADATEPPDIPIKTYIWQEGDKKILKAPSEEYLLQSGYLSSQGNDDGRSSEQAPTPS